MATNTIAADDRRMNDWKTEEVPVGNLHLSDLRLGSWGASWQPDGLASRSWLDLEEPHPPDEEPWPLFAERDGRPSFERHDAYGEDVLRLRRLILGR